MNHYVFLFSSPDLLIGFLIAFHVHHFVAGLDLCPGISISTFDVYSDHDLDPYDDLYLYPGLDLSILNVFVFYRCPFSNFSHFRTFQTFVFVQFFKWQIDFPRFSKNLWILPISDPIFNI